MTSVKEALAAIDKEVADDGTNFGDVGHALKLAQEALTEVQNRCCKNCKHWRSFMGDDPTSFGGADLLKLGFCAAITDGLDVEPNEGQLALTEDPSGCSGLRTAAEFGCVLFEAK